VPAPPDQLTSTHPHRAFQEWQTLLTTTSLPLSCYVHVGFRSELREQLQNYKRLKAAVTAAPAHDTKALEEMKADIEKNKELEEKLETEKDHF